MYYLKKIIILGIIIPLQTVCSAATIKITGAGSSFVYPVMTQWTKKYQVKEKKIKINYQSTGSSAGIGQLKNKVIDFAATDKPLSSQLLQRKQWYQAPIVKGYITPVFNAKNIHSDLNLTGKLLAEIYKGKIKYWDNDKIKQLNPILSLPHQSIIPVRRSDGSGTTYHFTRYLSKHDKFWRKSIGVDTFVDWPAYTVGAKGNAGVAAQVAVIPGSIGYLEYSYAKASHLPMIKLVDKPLPTADTQKLSPIVATTYLIIPKASSHTGEIKDFITWITRFGATQAKALGFLPVS